MLTCIRCSIPLAVSVNVISSFCICSTHSFILRTHTHTKKNIQLADQPSQTHGNLLIGLDSLIKFAELLQSHSVGMQPTGVT